MQGTTVDSKYQIVRVLGQGGMGAVYEARHLGTGRRVALKVIVSTALVAGSDMVARFQREARASGAIDSQHVVQVLDTGVDPATDSPYLVMEYLSGEDLQQVIRRVGALPVDVVLRMMVQACAGLARAHEQGIIHRDIKSANLFVTRREAGELTIKILDFGIAKVRADPMSSSSNQGITRTGALLGSPLYMSPEQVLGSKDIDARADVFSLGVTMYEALCGLTPNHECETVGMLVVAICGGRGQKLRDRAPSLPDDVIAIVDKALSVDPNARFQTTAEMQAAIAALLPPGTSALNESMFGPGALSMRSTPPLAQTPQGLTVPLVGAPVPSGPSGPSAPPATQPSPGVASGSNRPHTPSSPAPAGNGSGHGSGNGSGHGSGAPASSPPSPASQQRAVAATSTAFTDTASLPLEKTPRWMIGAPLALLLLCGAGIGIYRVRAQADVAPAASGGPVERTSAPATAAPVDSAATTFVGADSAPTPAATTAASAGSGGSAGATRDGTDGARSGADAAAPAVPIAALQSARPVGDPGNASTIARPRSAIVATPPPPPKPNCDPPYTYNSDGKKIWKRDCL